MKYQEKGKAVVLLADGTVFWGKSAGAKGTATGEICFNTGMTGYQEIFTDPSYYGQIMTCATAHIGNYGVDDDEVESNSVKINGLVCKRFASHFSRDRAEGSLQEYFEKENIVAVSDVDTRALVSHIRGKGAMNAIISSEEFDLDKLKEQLSAVPSMDGLELASTVSTKEAYEVGDANSEFRVALLDLGTKKNIIRCLNERGCLVKVFPHDSTLEEMMAWNPDGFMLSNGPGDPAPLDGVIATVKQIIDSETPTFGICLGHQVLALANGLSTSKMHNGHRGINHPILNIATGGCEVTSQNHGFVVNMDEAKASEDIEVTHIHLNDQTLAGMKLKSKPAFSVQYHPEAAAGPLDSRYLFDEFIDLMKKHKK